jgi:hypothetical protein
LIGCSSSRANPVRRVPDLRLHALPADRRRLYGRPGEDRAKPIQGVLIEPELTTKNTKVAKSPTDTDSHGPDFVLSASFAV